MKQCFLSKKFFLSIKGIKNSRLNVNIINRILNRGGFYIINSLPREEKLNHDVYSR